MTRDHVCTAGLCHRLKRIYAFQFGGLADSPIKIGQTTGLVSARLRQFQPCSPWPLVLLAESCLFRAHGCDVETALHHSLARHRVEGRREWFHPHDDVLRALDFINAFVVRHALPEAA